MEDLSLSDKAVREGTTKRRGWEPYIKRLY